MEGRGVTCAYFAWRHGTDGGGHPRRAAYAKRLSNAGSGQRYRCGADFHVPCRWWSGLNANGTNVLRLPLWPSSRSFRHQLDDPARAPGARDASVAVEIAAGSRAPYELLDESFRRSFLPASGSA